MLKERSQKFELVSEFEPAGDQPQAIKSLIKGLDDGHAAQTLLGVTGSGKTFTIAQIIARTGKSTLIISHNKTLAAQLYSELKQFFPKNNVGYFISYYDYYQPESYIPQTDTYIEKDTQVNEKIEQMRLEATTMLLSGEPTIIIATVSCIYSLGNPVDWQNMSMLINKNDKFSRITLVQKLINARYERNDTELTHGRFRIKGDTIDIIPAYSEDIVRISLFGDQCESITLRHPVSLDEIKTLDSIQIFPAKHYLIADDVRKKALVTIRAELASRLLKLRELEAQRLEMRTKYDLEMIEELGYCSGIENYSRHFDGRKAGQQAFCLMDFFDPKFLLVIDESHVTLPQLHAMAAGDRSRKDKLITHGFRLPSAFDNRPLVFEEFEKYMKSTIFVSATPSDYEKEMSIKIVEQLVRPTGLLDPTVEVRRTSGQMDDLVREISKRTESGERTLVTTLTKRMAEDMAEYLSTKQIRVRYMHSEIEGLQRTEIIRQLRLGEFDVLVGINLLREGLDIPEVSLVAIMDADKEGFLRNVTSLIQTFGRASRNTSGHVIMYADNITRSMKAAIAETQRRHAKQTAYNKTHKITPKTISKTIPDPTVPLAELKHKSTHDLHNEMIELESSMKQYALDLDFEGAIECRERIKAIQKETERKNED